MSDAPQSGEGEDHPQPSPGRVLAILALMLVLAAGGWLLVGRLSADSAIQDCVMAGHTNCAPVDPEPSRLEPSGPQPARPQPPEPARLPSSSSPR